jgi:hypothetical protein
MVWCRQNRLQSSYEWDSPHFTSTKVLAWRMLTYADACGRMLTYADTSAYEWDSPHFSSTKVLALPDTSTKILAFTGGHRHDRPVERHEILNVYCWIYDACFAVIFGHHRIVRQPWHRAPVQHVVCHRQRTSAYVSMRQHASACVSIRQHTSACVSIRQHTSAYVSIRQHTSAYVSIRQHTRHGGRPCPFVLVKQVNWIPLEQMAPGASPTWNLQSKFSFEYPTMKIRHACKLGLS